MREAGGLGLAATVALAGNTAGCCRLQSLAAGNTSFSSFSFFSHLVASGCSLKGTQRVDGSTTRLSGFGLRVCLMWARWAALRLQLFAAVYVCCSFEDVGKLGGEGQGP